ncbi:MAG TPA: VOC family protein [Actinomycetes bacterium]|jgi:predicted enzyme related to lactoylglutathione lyase|nr:VOC family protein [Actinomycetes bacterium]
MTETPSPSSPPVTNLQLVLDAGDPHTQAKFWAAALGWTVERSPEFVQQMLDAGIATPDDVVEVDGRLAWRTAEALRHPDHDRIRELGGAARMLFQLVPEAKTVKNRMHVDVNVGRDNIDATVARLEALGANVLWKVDEPGAFHTTMADPEGNEFCVQ